MNVWQYVAPNGSLSDSVYTTVDGHRSSCHKTTKLDLQTSPLVLVLGEVPSNATEVNVTMEGSGLYCRMFNEMCTQLATQVFARSFQDDPGNSTCSPLCGEEVTCQLVSASSTRDLCQFQCMCPPGGCNEVVLVVSEGAVVEQGMMDVCEISME